MAKIHKPLLPPARPLHASTPSAEHIVLELAQYRRRLEVLVVPELVRERVEERLQRLALMQADPPSMRQAAATSMSSLRCPGGDAARTGSSWIGFGPSSTATTKGWMM